MTPDPRTAGRLDAPDYELTWSNKQLLLDGDGEGGYCWVEPNDPHALEIHALDQVAEVGHLESGLSNMLIRGDALHALRTLSLEKEFAELSGQVRVVYIDPPFNTGQGYGQYGDDLHHSVWLSMLRDRLAAVKPLLAPLASVWVHLDDAETHRARCVLDEVFGPGAFVSTIVWQKRTTRDSRAAFSSNHDYIHVYAPAGPRVWKTGRNFLSHDTSTIQNRDGDPRGPWADAPFTAPGYRENQQYEILTPAGTRLRPPAGRSWYATPDVFDALRQDNRIWFPRNGAGSPRLKRFLADMKGLVPFSIWHPRETGTNDEATRHLMTLFPDSPPFATPKPESLIERILHIASKPGDLVLDFFAGSGTTAAVAHKMGRRWIAVEVSRDVVAIHARPRLTAVVNGEDAGGISKHVQWHGGGGFRVLEVATSSVNRVPDRVREHPERLVPVGPAPARSEPRRHGVG